jgi:hypothetical protein
MTAPEINAERRVTAIDPVTQRKKPRRLLRIGHSFETVPEGKIEPLEARRAKNQAIRTRKRVIVGIVDK